jgi:hypothetical protein
VRHIPSQVWCGLALHFPQNTPASVATHLCRQIGLSTSTHLFGSPNTALQLSHSYRVVLNGPVYESCPQMRHLNSMMFLICVSKFCAEL